MKDENITTKVSNLVNLINNVNQLMKELEEMNVEVRVSYIESKKSDNTSQGIYLWKVIEHNDYLTNE